MPHSKCLGWCFPSQSVPHPTKKGGRWELDGADEGVGILQDDSFL